MSGDQLRSFGRNDIGNRIEEFGTVAEGPGNATLGRSLLALGDLQESRRHLEIAMESGFDRPEVRTALGWVLARLYRSELNEALREKDRELRPLRIEQARKNLRDPALDLLTGHLRLSSAHTAKARLQYSTGGDSSETLKRAIQAAERAVQVSPDSSDAYRVLGNARLYVAFAGEKHGIDPTLERTRAIADLEKALELEPDNVSALNSLGLIHIDTINAARDRGFDPEPAIEAELDRRRSSKQDPVEKPWYDEIRARSPIERVNAPGVDDARPARCSSGRRQTPGFRFPTAVDRPLDKPTIRKTASIVRREPRSSADRTIRSTG